MPTIKNKIKRVCALYSILRTTAYPLSKNELRDRLYDKTGEMVCPSSIEKDLNVLKYDFDIDYMYNRYSRTNKGYYIPDANESTDKSFICNLFLYLSLQDIPIINQLLKQLEE